MAEAKEADKAKSTRSIGKYNIFETLGKGGYSWVKKGQDTETGAIVALKFMNRATDQWALEQAEQVRTEIKSLTQVRHENVMKLYAYNLSAKYPLHEGGFVKTILLVLEYCPGGELFDILYYADKLEEPIARTYFQQMIHGLQAVHKAGIAHRDLKPQNLLLDTKFCLKITDFGLSKIMETEEDRIMKTTYVGTRGYQAPELLKNQKYTNACDVFSMGVILFILLAGYPPFEAAHKTDKWYRPLATGNPDKFWHVHRGAKIGDEARDLIEKMLSYRPSKRISVSGITKHKWFDGPTEKTANLKEKLIGRFVQARENRKKDAKKTKDLKESNHKQKQKQNPADQKKRSLYKKANELLPAPEIPVSDKDTKRSLLCYYTAQNPYKAIYNLSVILEQECDVQVTFNQDKNPHKLNCVATTVRPDAAADQDECYYFAVNVYNDDSSVYRLIHFQPQRVAETMMWRRVMRNIMDTVSQYDILVEGGLPCLMVDHGKGKAVPKVSEDAEDKPDEEEAKEADGENLPEPQWEAKPSESSEPKADSQESTPVVDEKVVQAAQAVDEKVADNAQERAAAEAAIPVC